jgi:hypothetical protein
VPLDAGPVRVAPPSWGRHPKTFTKGDVLGGRKTTERRLIRDKVASQNREVVTMITEIVLWRLPEGMSREDATAKYRLSVPT